MIVNIARIGTATVDYQTSCFARMRSKLSMRKSSTQRKRNKKPVPSGLPSGRPKKRNSRWSQIVTTSGFKFYRILLAAFKEPGAIAATAELGWLSPLTDQ